MFIGIDETSQYSPSPLTTTPSSNEAMLFGREE